ncbi:hypothetical protein [Pseudoxanthomonas putridarboris]|uniref:Uncharacterized protein n=1 Tax=Pseudoxanthomonas putridarboris TaxID=752605 RepID=A0ABU9IVT2_9GAMM
MKSQVQSRLDILVARANAAQRRWCLRSELRQATENALAWLGAGPLVILAARLAGVLGPQEPGLVLLLCSLLAGPGLYIAVRLASAWWLPRKGSRLSRLALFDAQLCTQERIVTADDFVGTGDLSGFKRAAVEDAEAVLETALRTKLTGGYGDRWRLRWVSYAGVAVAAGLCLALILAARMDITEAPGQGRSRSTETIAAQTTGPSDEKSRTQLARGQAEIERKPTSRQSPSARVSPNTPASASAEKGARGASGNSASSAEARSAASATSSEGNASQAAASASAPEAEKAKDARPGSQPPKKPNGPSKGTGQSGVAQAGAQGANSPASSSPAALDKPPQIATVSTPLGNDPDASDEEPENEREEKSSGVSTVSPRENKAAVDRNASTTVPVNPEASVRANGRSGAGGVKKTRGVPSMILGVPIPDRVRGMPSPGNSTITRESTKPSTEALSPIEAQQQRERERPAGDIEHPTLLPWMQMMIRDYFNPETSRSPETN